MQRKLFSIEVSREKFQVHYRIITFFVNENLTLRNSKIAFLCRKLKRADHIEKTFTRDGSVHISNQDIQREKVLKIYHLNDLFRLFPGHDFGENIREDEQNDSIQSSY